MISFALAQGDANKARDIFWHMPLQELWTWLWCYYQYNGTKYVRYGEYEGDLEALLQ
tara:strand:- start:166 stop:336 length:171 start_codon:yes stop_codon:yes gene_type:complete